MNRQINCDSFSQQLNAYLDSELDQDTRNRMNEHAASCPSCGERLESMTRLLTMCAELDEGLAVPLEAQSAWRKAVRAQAASGRPEAVPVSRGRALRRWVGGVAAAMMLLCGGTFAYRLAGQTPLYAPKTAISADQFSAFRENEYYPAVMNATGVTRQVPLSVESDGELDMAVSPDSAEAAKTADAGQAQENPQVVLRTAQRTLESAKFDQSLQSIQDLAAEYEGYFEQSAVNGQALSEGGTGRVAELTARIPSDRLDDFLTSLDAAGTPVSKSESAQDISDRYYDAQSRLDGYRVQLKRLDELMGTAASLEDILLLEDKRGEVQQLIDSLEGQLKGWSGQAQRSTVYVTLNEVETRDQVRPIGDSLGERVKTAFYDSINWLGAFLQDAAVVLAMAAPVLVIAIPAIVVICILVSLISRRRKRRKGK